MEITVNGEARQIGAGTSISALLVALEVKMPDTVSVELNGEILDRDVFGSTTVVDGDKIEFLYFMGGGAATRPTGSVLAQQREDGPWVSRTRR